MSALESSSNPSPQMAAVLPGNALPNYVELAAIVIPPRKLGLPERIRPACTFLPMPLSLGWDADPGEEELPADATVPGLLLSDIGSGATRPVTARWMHALYKHAVETHPAGSLVMHLREAGFTRTFGWAHALLLATFSIQLTLVLFAMTHGQRREGWLVFAGGLIRVFEAALAWACPRHRAPRSEERDAPRYCALHTGMTTGHLIVLTHRFGAHGKCVTLEDAAAPLPRQATGRAAQLERSLYVLLKVCVWTQKGASLVTSANGYTIPIVLLLGTTVIEFVAATADTLPATSSVTVLDTGDSVLDRITAACQFTGVISVGFVESLLPDPRGLHVDYNWISQAMQPDRPLRLHDTHPAAPAVLVTTLRRRPQPQIPPTVPRPVAVRLDAVASLPV
ncbi:hypothetical protein B0H10DRAFT_2211331 [Mycena sp. CBHHK59/15]|nr:hypothetical protein B0H10DRAFT_2211331 [Mycena sp. CBHHK59/15]